MKTKTLRAVIAADRITNRIIKTLICAFLCAVAFWMVRNAPASAPLAETESISTPTHIEARTAPDNVAFRGRVAGEWLEWLKVARHNGGESADLWHPCYTNIVSDYKPIVKKRGDKWEIEFVSEIAEKLP
jgi:hypothetical protein